MNAHSTLWNPIATRNRNNVFWERLIQDNGLVIWNSEEVTRMEAGAGIHSVIDLTLSSPEVSLNWSIGPATGSDHELLQWEILGAASPEDATSSATTGWDVSGWDPKGKDIRVGHHPKLWKMAMGVVIPKPGKPDYSKVRAYRVMSLLDVVSKLVERTAAHLIADHLERKRGLHS